MTIDDQDGVSPSGPVGFGNRTSNVTAYQYYKFQIQNVGGSTLTQGTGSFTLTDHVVPPTGPSSDVNSSALYVPAASAPFCSATSTTPNTVSCTFQNLAAGSDPLVFYLVYRTSTTPNVTRTDLSGSVTFKESTPNGANPSTLPICNDPALCPLSAQTSLEPNPETSFTWSPTDSNVQMGTSPTFDTQWSVLQYTVPPGQSSFLANMGEGTDDLCPFALNLQRVKKCFTGAEKVTTVLSAAPPGTFSQTNPFHLTLNIDQNLITGNLGDIKMIHLGDNGLEVISLHCLNTPPLPTDTLPCITVDHDSKAKTDVIGVYGFQNGGWVPGI